MSKKIKYSELKKIMPKLREIGKMSKSKGISKSILKSSSRSQDLICKCIGVGLNNLDNKSFGKKQMKSLESQKEYLRFIRDYSKC